MMVPDYLAYGFWKNVTNIKNVQTLPSLHIQTVRRLISSVLQMIQNVLPLINVLHIKSKVLV